MIREIGLDGDNQSEDSMSTIFCVEHDGRVMTKAEYLTTVNTWVCVAAQGNTAATVKVAIFPLRLLLFYIVYNGGKSRTVRAQPGQQQSLSREKGKPLGKR
jgi:hypothetical protein